MRICAMHNSQHLDQIGSPPVASPDAVRLAMASHPCVASNDTHNPVRRSSTAGYRSCRREPIALKKKARQKDR
jgi:hypothetical protein